MKSRTCAVVTAVTLAGVFGAADVSAQSAAKPATGQISKSAEPIKDTKRFAEHTGLFRSSTVVGSSVKDLAGKDAGKIEDLLLNHEGDIAYAIVSFGGFLGVGDKLFAVPWSAVIVDRENRTVHVDVKKETLERSPSFSRDKWPDPNDREWGREVRKVWSDASITAAVKTRLAGTSPATLLKSTSTPPTASCSSTAPSTTSGHGSVRRSSPDRSRGCVAS